MYRPCLRVPYLLFLCFALIVSSSAQDSARQVPKEVNDIAGTFAGSWTMFGIDAQGQITKKAAWTDTVKAENPISSPDRAYVTTTTEMIFEGRPTPMKIDGKEGYFINKDGSKSDYFIETFGQVIRLQSLAKDVWVYTTPANPRELAPLGFTNVSSAQHVVVKVITHEDGVETHRISRVTTVNWKDQQGKDRWIQYVSLQGLHKRRS
jgi:hypothetical protein